MLGVVERGAPRLREATSCAGRAGRDEQDARATARCDQPHTAIELGGADAATTVLRIDDDGQLRLSPHGVDPAESDEHAVIPREHVIHLVRASLSEHAPLELQAATVVYDHPTLEVRNRLERISRKTARVVEGDCHSRMVAIRASTPPREHPAADNRRRSAATCSTADLVEVMGFEPTASTLRT